MTRIRLSEPEDRPRIIDIWRSAVDATHGFLSVKDRQDIETEVVACLPMSMLWVAVDNGDRAIGFMLIGEGQMEALFVDAAERGAGVGRALVEYAPRLCPGLKTDVNEQNVQAIGFYERMGFRRIGRSGIDLQGRPYPLIHLRHAIDTDDTSARHGKSAQMTLLELVLPDTRHPDNERGSKIPWNDPDFSRRMLENHLNQDHDWASRREGIIARHTMWIAGALGQAPSRILDIGCGPGLYTRLLSEAGHQCVGVDFSPASIEYAHRQAVGTDPRPEYVLSDVRNYRSSQKFDCIIMTFGEFNVFTRQDAMDILNHCAEMLRKNGLLVLEAHTYEAIQAIGSAPASWQRHVKGLFSDTPYLCLQENAWSPSDASALSRYFIVDAASAEVRQYSSFMQAYTTEEYEEMLHMAQLPVQRILDGQTWPPGDDFVGKLQVFVCRKKDAS